MYEASYAQMKEDWQNIISVGPHPFGSQSIYQCSQYISQEMAQLFPGTRTVEFAADGFHVEDWKLEIGGTPLDCYLMLGSGSCQGFEGHLSYAGLHRIWNMYTWKRYAVIQPSGEIAAYITVRGGGEGIPQTIAEMNTPLPSFIVGQQVEPLLQQAEKNATPVKGMTKTSVLSQATGRNVVVPVHEASHRVLLMAHYDTVYSTPGAYDNAAGTAVVMELARRLKNRRFKNGLEIVFMDGEEFMLLGSTHLAKTEGHNIDAVLNIDGVGRDNLLEIWSGPESFERKLRGYLQCHPEVQKSLFTTPPPPGSDHAPYYDLGIPVCMLTYNDQGLLHSPKDVYDESKLSNMAVMVRLVMGLLEYLGVVEAE